MQLRDYQKDLLARVEDALDADTDARVMMQLPTGGGKTIIAGELLKKRLTRGHKAVWMTHRKELADQTSRMLTDLGIDAEFVPSTSWKVGTDAPARSGGIVILMAPTVGSRKRKNVWGRYDGHDLLVIDEAHHATADSWERPMEQWPGQVMGMTATPWRLSEKEGFDQFSELIPGSQIKELQPKCLCDTKVVLPPDRQRIHGGRIGPTGDYIPSGIRDATHRGVWTAGARDFWKQEAQGRQTIAYAVSKQHARNLASVFNRAGISAGHILSDTPPDVRSDMIARFKSGDLKVLVNVLVVTEGFDLPDASCILVTRPTKSLALYMQMNGRGMRPKDDGGDCLILDMAYNSEEHGLPDEDREWSLEPRGSQIDGVAPFVHCEVCGEESSITSHECGHCGEPFGDECDRCGKWRAWASWESDEYCEYEHDLVCDYCHLDAHIQASLPVEDQLRDELAGLIDEDMGAGEANRRRELLRLIGERERLLNDEGALDSEFKKYIEGLTKQRRPMNMPQTVDAFVEWEKRLRKELEDWREEELQLSSGANTHNGSTPVGLGWLPMSGSFSENVVGRKPDSLWTPDGEELEVAHWNQVLVEVAEWLIEDGRLSEKIIDEDEDLDDLLPRTGRGLRRPERLSIGRFLETSVGAERVMRDVEWFIESTGSDAQFYVRLSK